MQTSKVTYRLRNKKTKKFLKLYSIDNGNAEFCNAETVSLTENGSEDDKYFEVDTIDKAEWVRHNDTAWFNSSEFSPKHEFDSKIEDIEIVRCIITEEFEPVQHRLPTKMEIYKDRKTHYGGEANHVREIERMIVDYKERCKKDEVDMDNDFEYDNYELYNYQRNQSPQGQQVANSKKPEKKQSVKVRPQLRQDFPGQ